MGLAAKRRKQLASHLNARNTNNKPFRTLFNYIIAKILLQL